MPEVLCNECGETSPAKDTERRETLAVDPDSVKPLSVRYAARTVSEASKNAPQRHVTT